jgi:hypothetical protein
VSVVQIRPWAPTSNIDTDCIIVFWILSHS